ncbi:MAG: TetR/AcrR family transcriptional regulator [Anaerolineae bacterium]|nr:TetR/AcrR family transcriptional regulator [Anaerolineae bacterium]
MDAKKDTRASIIQAAFEAFSENGYDKTSMDDIVRRSGLSKGTLYWHFKNKHDLLLATLDTLMGQMQKDLQAVAEMDKPASERLYIAFIEGTKMFLASENIIQLMANFFFQSSQSPEAQAIMRDAYAGFIDGFANIIQQGIDSGEFRQVDARMVAIMMMGAGDGVVFQSLLKPDWDVMQVLEMLFDFGLRGLRKEQNNT